MALTAQTLTAQTLWYLCGTCMVEWRLRLFTIPINTFYRRVSFRIISSIYDSAILIPLKGLRFHSTSAEDQCQNEAYEEGRSRA